MMSRRRFGALALALVPLVAACGSSSKSATDSKLVAPVRTTTTSSTVPLPLGRPERIVSLSATATETLFAIGAGDQVVAVDSFSNYPPEAPVTDLSAYEPNIEAIAKYQPDLVMTDGTNPDLDAQLNKLGIAVFAAKAPKNLDQVYQQIEQIGAATGNIATAGAVSLKLQDEINALLKTYTRPTEGKLVYYYELDNTFFSASSKTFIGAVFNELGLLNIADEVDTKQTAGYPQLTPEFILEKNPDVIFLADTKCCQQTAETVKARPGWESIRAVKEGRIVELDDDIANRWGPRVVEILRAVITGITGLTPDPDKVFEQQ